MIVAAHAHAFIVTEACAKVKRAAIGYHPSLLPRHRGIAAVEWTIRCRDPIAGGSIYHLTNGLDEGRSPRRTGVSSIPRTMRTASGDARSGLWA